MFGLNEKVKIQMEGKVWSCYSLDKKRCATALTISEAVKKFARENNERT